MGLNAPSLQPLLINFKLYYVGKYSGQVWGFDAQAALFDQC